MANVKVKSKGAIFNGQPIGSTIEMTEAEAVHYESIGYVERIAEESKPVAKAESAPTDADKPVAKPTQSKRKSTKDTK